MWHVLEKSEKCIRFSSKSPKERDHFEDRDVDGIRMDLRETGWGMWSGLSWLRTGVSGGLL
jgi:hypothetical protein